MAVLSAILYFLSQHSVLSMPLIILFWLIVGGLLARWFRQPGCLGLGILGFLMGMANVFLASSINALFVNAVGTRGSAVIVHSEQTNSQLNEQWIWRYEAVLRTADGRDVKFGFDTMSASLYPPRNEINIPPVGERFVVKYTPGFERNVAILRDESPFGKRLIVQEARAPVERARQQLVASPENAEFKAEYRAALQAFLARYAADAPPGLVDQYRRELARIDTPR